LRRVSELVFANISNLYIYLKLLLFQDPNLPIVPCRPVPYFRLHPPPNTSSFPLHHYNINILSRLTQLSVHEQGNWKEELQQQLSSISKVMKMTTKREEL